MTRAKPLVWHVLATLPDRQELAGSIHPDNHPVHVVLTYHKFACTTYLQVFGDSCRPKP
jgi:hypothetical protein